MKDPSFFFIIVYLVKINFSKRFKKITVQSAIDNKINEEVEAYLGKVGESATDLRPSGKVKIGEETLDAMTSGEFVEAGVAVEVINHSNAQIVVREIKS